ITVEVATCPLGKVFASGVLVGYRRGPAASRRKVRSGGLKCDYGIVSYLLSNLLELRGAATTSNHVQIISMPTVAGGASPKPSPFCYKVSHQQTFQLFGARLLARVRK